MPSPIITLNQLTVSIKAPPALGIAYALAGWGEMCGTREPGGPPPPDTHTNFFLMLLEMIIAYLHTVVPLAGKGGGVAHFFFNLRCFSALYSLIEVTLYVYLLNLQLLPLQIQRTRFNIPITAHYCNLRVYAAHARFQARLIHTELLL